MKKFLAVGLFFVLLIPVLFGAGEKQKSNAEEIVVYWASGNQYAPYCYVDKSGKDVGYEYEIIAEVDRRLKGYRFEHQVLNGLNVLLNAVDAGTIDLAAHEIAKNEEREKTYDFSVGYNDADTYLSVRPGNPNIKTIADLKPNQSLTAFSPSAQSVYINSYLAENPNAFIPDLISSAEVWFARLTSPDLFSMIGTKDDNFLNALKYENYNLVVNEGAVPVSTSKIHMAFKKNNERSTQIRTAVDEALNAMQADGTIAAIKKRTFDEYVESLSK
ncbi:conserved hypothetical protein [Treponema primitia ZAS-2]|uniref:Solute-binding protein family 3/N-terminal domain-containing protein n=1 Tax=Treponema primitia (strain ATCC BAA-887 / DSM 12427 / ZAS-2) TaxID=545694 RepID=F5YK72_TREPZ|nr:transporter substrate-binding domain-containing protein [Treponema primitia]AEF86635.1 conserved hypothetical protein [Treponema primitia ZAS-2]